MLKCQVLMGRWYFGKYYTIMFLIRERNMMRYDYGGLVLICLIKTRSRWLEKDLVNILIY